MNRWLVCAWLLAAALPLQAAEKIYRWVDADGGVHYSATPPPGQAVEEQDLRYQHTPDPAAAAAAQQRLQQDIDARREEEKEAAKTVAESSKTAASRRERCAAARGIVARLEGARGTRYRREDGSYVRYTDAEWQQKMSEARAAEQQSCD
jgi:hypothetical protein